MFRNFLIPTDGSALSCKAIEAAIALAKQVGAKVTGYCALPARGPRPAADEFDREIDERYTRRIRHEAKLYLDVIANEAARQGVLCNVAMTEENTPYGGIIKAAKERECDLIFMASHGRSGLPATILGSVAQKVITLAPIPVLVFRTP